MTRRNEQVRASGRDAASATGTQRTKRRCRLGRAYRSGRLICGWVQITISDDERLGLTRHERRLVGLRFHEPLDDGLRTELTQLLRRRGTAARRVAGRVAGGVSSPGAHRSRREPLDSPGSCHPAYGGASIQCANRPGSRLAIALRNCHVRVGWPRNRLNFCMAQRTR